MNAMSIGIDVICGSLHALTLTELTRVAQAAQELIDYKTSSRAQAIEAARKLLEDAGATDHPAFDLLGDPVVVSAGKYETSAVADPDISSYRGRYVLDESGNGAGTWRFVAIKGARPGWLLDMLRAGKVPQVSDAIAAPAAPEITPPADAATLPQEQEQEQEQDEFSTGMENWFGGDMPCNPGDQVHVITRDGRRLTDQARNLVWGHQQPSDEYSADETVAWKHADAEKAAEYAKQQEVQNEVTN